MEPKHLGPWKVGKCIGEGAFSRVYLGEFDGPSGQSREYQQIVDHDWVLKVSKVSSQQGKKRKKSKEASGDNLLFHEYTIYRSLYEHARGQAIPCFPQTPSPVNWKYARTDEWCFLAIEQLGQTVSGAVKENGGTANPLVAFNIAAQSVMALRWLHTIGYVYRDVKPENMMLGKSGVNKNRVYLVDFGAACKFMLHTGKQTEAGSPAAGTPLFMSRNIHRCGPPSPIDDLESVGYMLLWTLQGSLPWSDATSDAQILGQKEEMDVSDLCQGIEPKSVRATTEKFLKLVLNLKFGQPVDYESITDVLAKHLSISNDVESFVSAGLSWSASSSTSKKKAPTKRGRITTVLSSSDEEEEQEQEQEEKPKPKATRGRRTRKSVAQKEKEEEVEPTPSRNARATRAAARKTRRSIAKVEQSEEEEEEEMEEEEEEAIVVQEEKPKRKARRTSNATPRGKKVAKETIVDKENFNPQTKAKTPTKPGLRNRNAEEASPLRRSQRIRLSKAVYGGMLGAAVYFLINHT